MKKNMLFAVILAAFVGSASSCSLVYTLNTENPEQTLKEDVVTLQPEDDKPIEKTYTDDDIEARFHLSSAVGNRPLLGCAVVEDKAYDKIGVVLFESEDGYGTLAFMDEGGLLSSTAAPQSPVSSEPNFVYHGNGRVTFDVLDETGNSMEYSLTYSKDDSGNEIFTADAVEQIHLPNLPAAHGLEELFKKEKAFEDATVLDSIVIEDPSLNYVGMILYKDSSNVCGVAIMNYDHGFENNVLTKAVFADEPNLEYLGDYTFRYVLQNENGEIYTHEVTLNAPQVSYVPAFE